MSGLPSDHPLSHLSSAADKVANLQRVCHGGRLDTNNANARIILRPIMDSITKVAQPRLQFSAVRLLDQLAICHQACFARDGCPLARAIDEGYIDVGVIGQIVSFSGFGIRVEEEIDAPGFLYIDISLSLSMWRKRSASTYCCSQGHAARN